MGNIRNYLVNFLAQGAARILSTGSTVVVLVLAARQLPVDEFGYYSLILAFISIFAALSQFGSNEAVGKAVIKFGDQDVAGFISNFLAMRAVLAVGAAAIALIVVLVFRADTDIGMLVCILGIPFISARFFDPVFQVIQRPHYSVISSLFYSTLFLVGSLVALFKAEDIVRTLVQVYIATNVVYFFSAMVLLGRAIDFRLEVSWTAVKKIAWFAAPLGPAAFYSILNSRADLFFLSYFLNDEIVGLYNAAYRLVDFLGVGAIMLVAPLIPIFSKMVAADKNHIAEPLARSYEMAAFVAIPLVLVTPFISTWIVQQLYGGAFSPAATLINILVWVVVIVLFSLLSSTANLALGAIQHGYWSGGIAVVINVALNLWWIPLCGAEGAAFATLISSTVWFLISHYYTHRVLGTVIDKRYWACQLVLGLLLWAGLWTFGSGLGGYAVVLGFVFYFSASVVLKLHPVMMAGNLIRKLLTRLGVGV